MWGAFFIGIGTILVAVILLYYTNLTIRIRFSSEGLDCVRFQITVSVAGIFRFRPKFVIRSGEEEVKERRIAKEHSDCRYSLEQLKEEVETFLQMMRRTNRVLQSFLQLARIRRFFWVSEVGLGDAADTGMAVGWGWVMKSFLLNWLHARARQFDVDEVRIEPHYRGMRLTTDCSCMISLRLGHAIRAGWETVKLWKRRQLSWQNNIQSKV